MVTVPAGPISSAGTVVEASTSAGAGSGDADGDADAGVDSCRPPPSKRSRGEPTLLKIVIDLTLDGVQRNITIHTHTAHTYTYTLT